MATSASVHGRYRTSFTDGRTGEPSTRASEGLSMAAEYIPDDPIGCAIDDPDDFNFYR
jgi:hypothetical protein